MPKLNRSHACLVTKAIWRPAIATSWGCHCHALLCWGYLAACAKLLCQLDERVDRLLVPWHAAPPLSALAATGRNQVALPPRYCCEGQAHSTISKGCRYMMRKAHASLAIHGCLACCEEGRRSYLPSKTGDLAGRATSLHRKPSLPCGARATMSL